MLNRLLFSVVYECTNAVYVQRLPEASSETGASAVLKQSIEYTFFDSYRQATSEAVSDIGASAVPRIQANETSTYFLFV